VFPRNTTKNALSILKGLPVLGGLLGNRDNALHNRVETTLVEAHVRLRSYLHNLACDLPCCLPPPPPPSAALFERRQLETNKHTPNICSADGTAQGQAVEMPCRPYVLLQHCYPRLDAWGATLSAAFEPAQNTNLHSHSICLQYDGCDQDYLEGRKSLLPALCQLYHMETLP